MPEGQTECALKLQIFVDFIEDLNRRVYSKNTEGILHFMAELVKNHSKIIHTLN